MKQCIVPDCLNLVRSGKSNYCEKHYYRIRRNGTLDVRPITHRCLSTGGYVSLFAPGHPLIDGLKTDRIYEHRAVYYERYGSGPFACHWCGKTVTWKEMHIDHLNNNKIDNRIDNIVASCPVCNQARGREKMIKTSREKRGVWFEFNGNIFLLRDLATNLGISYQSMTYRLSSGWTVERALTTPRGVTGPMSKRRTTP